MKRDRRVMRHDLLAERTQVAGCYPRPEYWRVELTFEGEQDGELVSEGVTLTPDVKVRASQMHWLVIRQWREISDSLDRVDSATLELFRISPSKHRKLVDDELAQILESEEAYE